MSSPRPWGCFWLRGAERILHEVFPTPVGVFPARAQQDSLHLGLPHARGGVSGVAGGAIDRLASSPRPWGCFLKG